MPRPRVPLENRKRTYHACLLCKASKVKCNSELPCSACIKRGRDAACLYSDTERRRKPRPLPQSHRQQPQQQQQDSALHPPNSLPNSPPNSPSPIPTPPELITNNGEEPNAFLPKATSADPLRGNSYAGETTPLSFLGYLQKTLKPYVGLIRFTDGDKDNLMHEVNIRHVDTSNLECSSTQMYTFLEFYFEATSGFLDLFTADEIDTLIYQRARPNEINPRAKPAPEDFAALDAALAIGAQVLPPNRSDRKLEEALFSRARQVAFDGMLMKPTLSMVRLFLLMTFYMLGVYHRSAATMYLTVATKAAVVLGLDNLRDISAGSLDSRSRTWTSVRILDVLASFILGRPQNLLPTVQSALQSDNTNEALTRSGRANFAAMSKGCSLVEDIVRVQRKESLLNVSTAEELLNQLRCWTQSLPDTVRQFSSGDVSGLDPADRQALIGSVHISCLYYFGVILITRPFLVAYLMSRLRGRAPDHLINDPKEASDLRIKNNKVSRLAQVCVGAATYMALTLQKIKSSGFTLGNLCFVKSWIFGSGLVLGFSKFAGEPRQDIDEAFDGCREVLKSMGEACHQAQVYQEVLASFSEAIYQYRRYISAEARRTVQHYMDQVLVVDIAHDEDHDGRNHPRFGFVAPNLSDHSIPHADSGYPLDLMSDSFQIDWTEMDLHGVDQLSPNFGYLESLLYSME